MKIYVVGEDSCLCSLERLLLRTVAIELYMTAHAAFLTTRCFWQPINANIFAIRLEKSDKNHDKL